MATLKYLFLNDNLIKTLPGSLDKLPALEDLTLENNRLQAFPIPQLTSLPKLRWLSLRFNRNIQITPNITKTVPLLEVLELSACRLRQLPEFLAGLTRLRILNLCANKFETIPPIITSLTALEYVNLSYNKIKNLASYPYSNTALTTLALEGNLFSPAQIQRAMMNHDFPHLKQLTN